ncbi:MAG: TonB-dependent receptor [Bacteroidales bacterium]|nr:TonB-dependent receptor [Bacteroidales bacterium]
MKKILFIILAVFAAVPSALAQVYGANGEIIDTTNIYKDRSDSLEATVFVSRQAGNYLSKGKPIRTEVISAAGLCKMACCNLAESFENSASVTVGYSDAVTGARQIRLLGLSGTYTQMLDENRPVMRGLAAPFGLSYVPGQWLESIQIAKGASSVINGVESITGQINLEHRKPTDEKPLFINAAVMSDTKMDLNVASSLQMGANWSTVILGHVSGNIKSFDHNHDGYLDDPKMLQFNLANRWLYYADNGVQVRFGVRALQDRRRGGQDGYNHESYMSAADKGTLATENHAWGSDILNRSLNGYVKVGVPLNEDNSQNIAVVADYNYYDMDSYFGATKYLAGQHSAFVNLLYQNEINESHKFTVGLSGTYDRYNEDFLRMVRINGDFDPALGTLNGFMLVQGAGKKTGTDLMNAGVFGEYTFHAGDKFSAIAGVRGDWYNGPGFKFSPRVTLKYSPIDEIVLRANGGRGLRYATPLVDNIGVFSTGKTFVGDYNAHTLEDAWTFGGNITYYFPFGSSTYLSFDYFRTQFAQQMVVDYELGNTASSATQIAFYNLDGRRSFTDNYQVDFNIEPIERFTVTATFRYTNAKIELEGQGLVERPLTSRYKGVLNLQYATNLNKWIFDFTASVNGPSRVYNFMKELKDEDGNLIYRKGLTPVYPLLYLQVTRRFKGVDVYIGGENLTNYRQKDVILGGARDGNGHVSADQASFDASAIWGPLMGIKVYAGVRFTLWKTN